MREGGRESEGGRETRVTVGEGERVREGDKSDGG